MLDLWLAGAPCDFLLDSCEGACVDDCRVIILDIVFVPFAVICLNSLADTVGHIGFVYNGTPLYFSFERMERMVSCRHTLHPAGVGISFSSR